LDGVRSAGGIVDSKSELVMFRALQPPVSRFAIRDDPAIKVSELDNRP
jgi:hypothetical protein